jgi:hypothetical protein
MAASRSREEFISSSSSESANETPRSYPFLTDIERVKATNHGDSILFGVWSKQHKLAWDRWWKRSQWRQDNSNEKIKWVSKTSSDVWTHFRQVARISDGYPFIQCERCSNTIQHPQLRGNGTSAMQKHLNTEGCRAKAERDGHGAMDKFVSKLKMTV